MGYGQCERAQRRSMLRKEDVVRRLGAWLRFLEDCAPHAPRPVPSGGTVHFYYVLPSLSNAYAKLTQEGFRGMYVMLSYVI